VQELEKYSNGAKEFFQKEDENSPVADIMPTIKYTFPKRNLKKGEKAKPLTKDQQLSNTIFMRLLKQGWEEARRSLDVELGFAAGETSQPPLQDHNSAADDKSEGKSNGGEGKEGNEDPKMVGKPKEGENKDAESVKDNGSKKDGDDGNKGQPPSSSR